MEQLLKGFALLLILCLLHFSVFCRDVGAERQADRAREHHRREADLKAKADDIGQPRIHRGEKRGGVEGRALKGVHSTEALKVLELNNRDILIKFGDDVPLPLSQVTLNTCSAIP